jgi:hypothetical protein
MQRGAAKQIRMCNIAQRAIAQHAAQRAVAR